MKSLLLLALMVFAATASADLFESKDLFGNTINQPREPISFQQIGDNTFYSDGGVGTRIGDTTFYSGGSFGDGVNCTRIGGTTFCN